MFWLEMFDLTRITRKGSDRFRTQHDLQELFSDFAKSGGEEMGGVRGDGRCQRRWEVSEERGGGERNCSSVNP